MTKTQLKLVKKYKFVYLLLLPVLLYFLTFCYVPLFLGIVQSFQKSKLLGPAVWAGFDNYKAVISDETFITSLKNGFVMGALTLIGTIVLSLVVAIGLNEIHRHSIKTAIQTTTYLPYLFSWTVVGGMWVYILGANGLFNSILQTMGQKAIMFMSEPKMAQWIIIATGIWKMVGYYAVLFIASIVTINPNLYEAAQLDGASREKQIRKIIIPELVPTIKTLVIIGVMGIFLNFDQILVMGNAAVLDTIRTPMYYIYENGITRFDIGLSTSAAVLVLLLTMVMTWIVTRVLDWRRFFHVKKKTIKKSVTL